MLQCPHCHTPISKRRAFGTPVHSTLQCPGCGAVLQPSPETLRQVDKITRGWSRLAAALFVFSALILLWGPEVWWHWATIIIVDLAAIALYAIAALRAFEKEFKLVVQP